MHLWCHQQSIVMSSPEHEPMEWDVWRLLFLSSFMDLCIMLVIKWYMYSHDEMFMHWPQCYFCVYFPYCFPIREKLQNNHLVSSWTVCHSNTYIIWLMGILLSVVWRMMSCFNEIFQHFLLTFLVLTMEYFGITKWIPMAIGYMFPYLATSDLWTPFTKGQ